MVFVSLLPRLCTEWTVFVRCVRYLYPVSYALCCAMPCYARLGYAILYYAMLCYATLCHATLYLHAPATSVLRPMLASTWAYGIARHRSSCRIGIIIAASNWMIFEFGIIRIVGSESAQDSPGILYSLLCCIRIVRDQYFRNTATRLRTVLFQGLESFLGTVQHSMAWHGVAWHSIA